MFFYRKCADNKSLRISLLFRIFGKEGDGYLLCYKRLETGRFQWPRNGDEVREITDQQLRWLMEGLNPEPKKRIPKVYPGQPDGI